MKKVKTYTSTLPDDVMGMVREYSMKYKVPKNKIVEKALRRFFFEMKREEYREGFKKMANDPEMIEMAEEGIDDFREIMERYDKGEI
jgi:hypothetical protein